MVPLLLVPSVSVSVGRLGHWLLLKAVLFGLAYCILTNLVGQIITIVLALIFQPGVHIRPKIGNMSKANATNDATISIVFGYLK